MEPGHDFFLLASQKDKIVAGDLFSRCGGTRSTMFHASLPGIFLTGRRLLIGEGIKHGRNRGLNFWTLV